MCAGASLRVSRGALHLLEDALRLEDRQAVVQHWQVDLLFFREVHLDEGVEPVTSSPGQRAADPAVSPTMSAGELSRRRARRLTVVPGDAIRIIC